MDLQGMVGPVLKFVNCPKTVRLVSQLKMFQVSSQKLQGRDTVPYAIHNCETL
jgi:hypothetical protein